MVVVERHHGHPLARAGHTFSKRAAAHSWRTVCARCPSADSSAPRRPGYSSSPHFFSKAPTSPPQLVPRLALVAGQSVERLRVADGGEVAVLLPVCQPLPHSMLGG